MPAIDIPHKRPGDDLFAREVNEFTQNINSLLGTKGPNTIVDSSGVHQRRGRQLGRIQAFIFVSDGDDILECHTWDGVTEGSTTVKIAKPYLLRKTPFHDKTIDGLTFTITGSQRRTVTRTAGGTLTEQQRIIPVYRDAVDDYIGDIVYAIEVDNLNITDDGTVIRWLDLNVDGRQWGRNR